MADLMVPSDFHDFRVSTNGTIYVAEMVMNNNLMTGVYTSDGTPNGTLM